MRDISSHQSSLYTKANNNKNKRYKQNLCSGNLLLEYGVDIVPYNIIGNRKNSEPLSRSLMVIDFF